MKRIVSFTLVILLLFLFVSCNNGDSGMQSSEISQALQSSEISSEVSQPSSEESKVQPQPSSSSPSSSSQARPDYVFTEEDLYYNLMLDFPSDNGYSLTNKPEFSWTDIGAKSYTFYLYEKSESSFKLLKKQSNIKTAKYKLDFDLVLGRTYCWKVEAFKNNKTIKHVNSTEAGACFMTVKRIEDGKNYKFDKVISQDVLKNYLAKSITLSLLSIFHDTYDEDIRLILNTGAKYISRAAIPWIPETNYDKAVSEYRKVIDKVHEIDPDIVFETCIFETVDASCKQVAIPAWVFEAFGQKPENRTFSYEKMLFPNGEYVNYWKNKLSVPDITQLETQMYFYYRACQYIDAGFEAIHWGQVMLIGKYDKNHACYSRLINMVREYATKNARRHFVFNNAHTHGMVGPDGVLLFDFHAFPMRGVAEDGSVDHAPTEQNPQKVVFKVNHLDSIYKRSLGGKTYSGWSCESLPYFVEIDNFWPGDKKYLNMAHPPATSWMVCGVWGLDDISWFANQPASYRHKWLEYAYNWVKETDPAGRLCMVGSRGAYIMSRDIYDNYFAHDNSLTSYGFGDEAKIKEIWSKA
ncbi:MAG: hypothetical protein E7480_07890 [Ruminococcaceae bacterium]|nr:hypothetical protein [Oscillospiraceae bacterium]